ncbi:adenylyltransferase/cytidyltransferase family protein [Yunchengibacter salinarum]|uniref:adenylyltransferase/cytidyltransferase family protein n=1 Tax=Yunchengibacter salinarum TaxID=3133399 RepID=UPI0035B5982C
MTTVITYGTFDLFHVGHVRLLERARGFGDRLVVGLSTDAFNETKGKTTLMPYAHRAAILESCRHVDRVIPEESWDQKRRDIQAFGVDVFVMGDDWRGRFDDLGDLCRVEYLPRTRDVSSSQLKQAIRVFQQLDQDLS